MSVIGSREFKLIMSMEDKTKREREDLDKYLGKLGTSADKLSGKLTMMAGALAASASLKAMASFGMEAVNAFAGAEASAQRLDLALQMRGMKTAAPALNALAQSLQRVAGIDGDLVVQLEAEMVAQGKSEAQIRKTITAAAALSSMTGGDLRGSMESLNGTLAGQARELGKMIPAIKDMTEEQLRSGAAVDFISNQYGEFIGKTGSTQIALNYAKESFGDLGEAMGQGLAPIVSEGALLFGRLAAVLATVPGPVKAIGGIIITMLIGAMAALALKTIILTAASWGLFGAKMAVAAAEAALNPLLFIGIGAAVAAVAATGLLVAAKIREANATKAAASEISNNTGIMATARVAADNYRDSLKTLGDEELKSARASLFHAMSLSTSMDALTVANAKLRELDAELARRKDAGAKAAAESAAKAAANFAAIMDDYKMKLLQQAGDRLGILDLERAQAIAKLQEQLKDKDQLGKAMVELEKYYGEERRRSLEEMNRNVLSSAQDAARQARDASSGKAANLGAAIPGDAIQAAVSGGGSSDILASALSGGDPMTMIVGFITKLGNLMAIMNPLQTILQAVFDVLAPVINNLLAPFVGILKILGMTLGKMLVPVLELLRPLIEGIALAFVWLYNKAIVPVVNWIIGGLNKAFNAFAKFVNSLLKSIDDIPGVDLSYRVALKNSTDNMLSTIDMSTLAAAGSASGSSSSSGGGGGGGGASYAAGTTIRIEKIEIKADFIAGDAGLMDVAVMLRDKIIEAERIGR